jgi:hypothetical protein
MSSGPQYSDADVRAIIERALTRSGGSNGSDVSHEDLLSIGEQIGLTREAIEQGARELAEERQHNDARAAVAKRRRRWLALHGLLFALLNAVAFGVNALTTPGEWWSLFSIVPWGLALALHVALSFGLPISDSAIARQLTRRPSRLGASRVRVAATETAASPPAETEPEASTDATRRARG